MQLTPDHGRYQVDVLVGWGPNGEVFRARDRELERWVAIKLLHRRLADSPGRVARFEAAVCAASRVVHPGAVMVFDAGRTRDGRPFAITEWIDGHDLATEIAVRGPLGRAPAAALEHRLAAPLRAADAAGVSHGAVKPSNILLADDGRVLLSDFGLDLDDGLGALSADLLALRDVLAAAARNPSTGLAGAGAGNPPATLREVALRRRPEGHAAWDANDAGVTRSLTDTGRRLESRRVGLGRRRRRIEAMVAATASLAAIGAFAPALLVSHPGATAPRSVGAPAQTAGSAGASDPTAARTTSSVDTTPDRALGPADDPSKPPGDAGGATRPAPTATATAPSDPDRGRRPAGPPVLPPQR